MKRSLFLQVGGAGSIDFETLATQVRVAEAAGIETIWCFPATDSEGGFEASASEIWLAGLASRTQRIRLGWVLVGLAPPDAPPLRVAEQAATLDVASGGRLEIGLLPGDVPDVDGLLESDGDRDWQEGYRMLVEMWDRPTFSWHSARFAMRPVDVLPKPIQRPHPPLTFVGWTAMHADRAGAGGLGFLDVSGAAPDALEYHRDRYRAARRTIEASDLVSAERFAIAVELTGSGFRRERLADWRALEVDEVVARVGMLEGEHARVCERIRLFADGETGVSAPRADSARPPSRRSRP